MYVKDFAVGSLLSTQTTIHWSDILHFGVVTEQFAQSVCSTAEIWARHALCKITFYSPGSSGVVDSCVIPLTESPRYTVGITDNRHECQKKI